MNNKFKNKVVVITGASSGIGYSIAKLLSEKGCRVYDISRTLVSHNEITQGYEGDVNDIPFVDNVLKSIFEKEGKIDVFINNAGFGIAGAIENAQYQNIYNLVNTNLSAVISLSGVAAKYLKQSGGGNIVNISSVGGIIPLPYQATYSATKAGVEIFSRAFANEVRDFNIKVTAILPGDTKTNFTKSRIIDLDKKDENFSKSVVKSIKKVEKDEQTGKSPESVAKVVLKVLKKKHPPLRKTVGFEYKLVVFLPRILSTKFMNKILHKLYVKI